MKNREATWAKREGKQPGRHVEVLFLCSVSVLSGAFCMFFEPGKVKWMERKIKNRSKNPNGLKRIKRVIHLISHTFSKRKQSQSRHDLCFGRDSPTMRPFLPVTLVGLALRLTVSLGVASLVGVVRVLGSARHAGGFLFCWILTDFHCTTSFGSIIHHYKIKIKIKT